MSDKLESFIRNNREQFDSQVPSNQVWANIQAGIAQQAATAAGSSAAGGAAAKTGLAKLALGWKIAIVAAFSAIVATGVYVAVTHTDNQDGRDPQGLATVTPQNADDKPVTTTQVEYMYEASPMVTPPLPGADVAYQGFTVDADKGGEWTAPSGTTLKVAPGTFVDAQGNPVKGDVQLKYREFHDAEDIILSGITMKYDENGAQEDFQTAGMMEILGTQGESPVFIAPGKGIDVRMASFTPEDNYNLYFLDPQKGWKDIGKPKTEKNKKKQPVAEESLMESLDGSSPAKELSKPRPPVKGVKGVEQEGEVMFTVNFDEFPELKPYKGVRWLAEDKQEYKRLEDKIHSRVWNEVKLDELDDAGLRYKITLIHKSKSTLSIHVKPILEGEDYEKGMERFREKKVAYDKMLAERENEADRLSTQADVYRSFSISGFGIYNCDRFYGMQNVVTYRTDFIFPEDNYMDASKTLVFHITGNNRAVLTLMPNERSLLKFAPNEQNFLVAVMPNNKVAVFGPEGFAKLLQSPKTSNAQVKFEAKAQEVHNAADLRLVLGV